MQTEPAKQHENNVHLKLTPRKDNLFSILKSFFINFLKFFGIRACLTLLPYLFKNLKRLNLSKILTILLQKANFQTAALLSILPGLYRLLNFLTSNYDNEYLTFFNATIAAFIGSLFAENNNFVNFIFVSAFVRSIHSLLVLYLKKHNLKSKSKFYTWLAYYIAIIGFLFLSFYHPEYKQVAGLFDTYGNLTPAEKIEIDTVRHQLRIV